MCSLTSESHYCSPRVLIAAWCIQQLKLLFLSHLAIPGFPQSNHTVSKISADADSLWSTLKQAARPQVILKTQPPISLYYKSRNRPQLIRANLIYIYTFGIKCCPQAAAMTPEVIFGKIFVYFTTEAQYAVTCTISACTNMSNNKDT